MKKESKYCSKRQTTPKKNQKPKMLKQGNKNKPAKSRFQFKLENQQKSLFKAQNKIQKSGNKRSQNSINFFEMAFVIFVFDKILMSKFTKINFIKNEKRSEKKTCRVRFPSGVPRSSIKT